ncbi:hypothetical protein RirG_073050 [Rhizophagus irregularis DAOM 197198w]|uniref:Kelch-like protein 17 n=1 Tax=Rhizophagus irregularis (strain DAOM 197198w) TaxID=1432141 RepID=A0A015MZ11_RHIIW|nr:hypothetical protein RirG_073050 [Rhizophagus irregularis DAOM 197198w]
MFNSRAQIIQHEKYVPSTAQEWDYDYKDNTISLKSNRKFVLDVTGGKCDNHTPIILCYKHGGGNQQFILEKWNDVSLVENIVECIIDNCKFLPKLSQNFLEILNDDEYYDINIEVGNDPHVKIFHAHMAILNYRSSYLRRIFSANKKKNDGTLMHIKLPNILPDIFEIILSGRLSLKECDSSDIIKLLVAANELNLQELITYIQSFLIENKTNWIEQNFNLIYRTSFENDSFLDLQKYCNNLISNEPDKIFKSQHFISIPEKLLTSVIQSDNLQMSEIRIWEYVLKWGISQNPELPSDLMNYSKEDFNTLKNTLHQCIPFIRFYNLTSKEFADKVFPYKRVLPKELRKGLLLSYLDPDNKKGESNPRTFRIVASSDIDSNIITYQHAKIISEWIDRLEINEELDSPYEFKLLFRGSRDGFSPYKFHEICDLQSHTVIIAKVKGNNEIIGGYNPIEWKSADRYSYTKDSFIFSFNNKDRNDNYVLSRINDNQYAINNRSYYGPSFGNGDLIIWGLDISTFCNYCHVRKNSYERSIRETEDRFSIEECEIFQVMKIY